MRPFGGYQACRSPGNTLMGVLRQEMRRFDCGLNDTSVALARRIETLYLIDGALTKPDLFAEHCLPQGWRQARDRLGTKTSRIPREVDGPVHPVVLRRRLTRLTEGDSFPDECVQFL